EVMFDKTGTLTEGKLSISYVHSFFVAKAKMLAYAAALEHYARHPIAQAIQGYCEKLGVEQLMAEDAQHRLGFGVIGRIGKHQVLVGNERMLQAEGKPLPPYVEALAQQRKRIGETVCFVYLDDR